MSGRPEVWFDYFARLEAFGRGGSRGLRPFRRGRPAPGARQQEDRRSGGLCLGDRWPGSVDVRQMRARRPCRLVFRYFYEEIASLESRLGGSRRVARAVSWGRVLRTFRPG